MQPKHIDRHNQCQCEIRYRYFKGKDKPTPGLFCTHHDVFLDWLKPKLADELIQNGVKVAPYLERKKSKKSNIKSRFYQISKKLHIRAKQRLTLPRRDSTITV